MRPDLTPMLCPKLPTLNQCNYDLAQNLLLVAHIKDWYSRFLEGVNLKADKSGISEFLCVLDFCTEDD